MINSVMTHAESSAFLPVLTIMVDYGNAPFLWIIRTPDEPGIGPNLCDGSYWDESFPITEGLWRKFADWAIEFDRTAFYSAHFDTSGWDWGAFHERGIELSRWLKEEVGDVYRVIYTKPCEDPEFITDERREILADGTLVSLPSFRRASEPRV